MKICKTA